MKNICEITILDRNCVSRHMHEFKVLLCIIEIDIIVFCTSWSN